MDDLLYDIAQVVADAYMRQERSFRLTLFLKTSPLWIQGHHFDMISTLFYPIYRTLRHSEFQCLMLLNVDPHIPSNWDSYVRVAPLVLRYMILCQRVEFICAFS